MTSPSNRFDFDDKEEATPPFNEVEATLRKAKAANLTPEKTHEMLSDLRREKMVAVIQILQLSASQNPELQCVLEALVSNDHEAVQAAVDCFHDYPIVQQFLEAIEQGFVDSPESTVVFPTLKKYRKAMDDMLSKERI